MFCCMLFTSYLFTVDSLRRSAANSLVMVRSVRRGRQRFHFKARKEAGILPASRAPCSAHFPQNALFRKGPAFRRDTAAPAPHSERMNPCGGQEELCGLGRAIRAHSGRRKPLPSIRWLFSRMAGSSMGHSVCCSGYARPFEDILLTHPDRSRLQCG